MEGCQDWRLNPNRRIFVHRSDTGKRPFCRSICEMLQESSEEEDDEDKFSGNVTYEQQLQR